MKKKYILGVVVLIFIAVGSVFYFTKRPQEKLGGESTSSSFLTEFVRTVSRAYKPTTGGGILPEPPRAMIKTAEGLLKEKVNKPVKISYAFTDYAAKSSSPHIIVVLATPDPFRWRVDFIMNLKTGEYKNIYLYDGSIYSTCSVNNKATPDCGQVSSRFLEDELQTPLPLTEFLNDILDPLILKKFVSEEKTSQVQIQKDSRTIAGYLADCQIVDDQYGTLDFCFTKDQDLLLHLDVKRKSTSGSILRHFTITAQSVDFSPLPNEIFTSP